LILYTLDDLFLVRVISIVLLVVDLTSFIKEIETVEWEVHFAMSDNWNSLMAPGLA